MQKQPIAVSFGARASTSSVSCVRERMPTKWPRERRDQFITCECALARVDLRIPVGHKCIHRRLVNAFEQQETGVCPWERRIWVATSRLPSSALQSRRKQSAHGLDPEYFRIPCMVDDDPGHAFLPQNTEPSLLVGARLTLHAARQQTSPFRVGRDASRLGFGVDRKPGVEPLKRIASGTSAPKLHAIAPHETSGQALEATRAAAPVNKVTTLATTPVTPSSSGSRNDTATPPRSGRLSG
jgi:hypothetical protein